MVNRSYSNCPLKKRPIKWDFQNQESLPPSFVEEEPENLSTKPEDLRVNFPSQSQPQPQNYPLSQCKVLCPVSFNTPPQQQQQQQQHQQPQQQPFASNPWTECHYDHGAILQQHSYPVMRIQENYNSTLISPPLSLPNMSPSIIPTNSKGANNRYHCPTCSKSYSTYSGLSKHSQFHCNANQSKSFICKFCEKVYVSLGALKMHIRTHTLPCKCTLCGKAFSRPWLLQGHIRTHTGEKPFNCQHCNRAFADRSNLRAHLQTHSELKKYSCGKCGKSFSRVSLLTKHEENCC